ncbi:MAG: tRNA U34 5-methylaminomethyl-2-thiouridine-forming methyltransferase MnmC [Bacteroidia bacterium]|jgi:tRNA U34 5-methylaminomethyl-2-thiouridine-forming methyltransferase MnmC
MLDKVKDSGNTDYLPRKVITTFDGSSSLYIPEMDEAYHSHKGAVTESQFIYIKHGFDFFQSIVHPIKILEVGMGTGLNIILTLQRAQESNQTVDFHTLEPYPLIKEEYDLLNFDEVLKVRNPINNLIHSSEFEKIIELSSTFKLTKYLMKLEDFETDSRFDLIYFDAFAPGKQPSPWVLPNIEKVFNLLESNGLLVTYCAQGQFKRNLKQVGFEVENPFGPMGKREITVARKNG